MRTWTLVSNDLNGWPRGLGAGRQDRVTETKPEDVIKFVDNIGFDGTALYQTAGFDFFVEAICMTGGASFVTAIRRLFEEKFGDNKPIHAGQEFTSVAEGPAILASAILR